MVMCEYSVIIMFLLRAAEVAELVQLLMYIAVGDVRPSYLMRPCEGSILNL